MKTKKFNEEVRDSDIGWLKKEGIIVYPAWHDLKKCWYMEVDLSKRFPNKPKKDCIIRYLEKPLSTKNTLTAKDYNDAWTKTLKYWRKRIGDENRKKVQRPE